MRLSCLLLSLALAPHLQGQSSSAAAGARAITQADVARRINLVADDSMGGRDTPSRGLDLTARYIASEFQRLGLQPGGDSGGYLQHYPIRVLQTDLAASTVQFKQENGNEITLPLGKGASLLFGGPRSERVSGKLVLVGGPLEEAKLAGDELRESVLVWVADWSKGMPPSVQALLGVLNRGRAKFLVAVVNNDTLYSSWGGGERTGSLVLRGDQGSFLIAVPEREITSRVPEAAEQFTQLRTAGAMTLQPLPDWEGTVRMPMVKNETVGAPNVVGILPGSDPALRNEYLVFSGHMDHVGSRCRGGSPADSICNGADDDGSGTVGVLELAQAFAQKGARPKRSLIFLTVSGEERGLWGSQAFVSNPPVPLGSMVADLNMDMIGRNWKDTIVVIGREHSDLGTTLDRVAGQHPELRMTPVNDLWPNESLYTRSDHFNFARRGVPILFFTSGLHPDYHAVTDSPDKIDAEKEARLLQLVYYLGQEVANRAERPRWNPESRKKIVETP